MRWDGTVWMPLGTGIPTGEVYCVAVYNGSLYAGGRFTNAGGVACSNIARWDGTSWQPVGAGTDGDVFAMTVWGGSLIVGGEFLNAGGSSRPGLAQWNSAGAGAWSSVGTGLGGAAYPTVRALATYNGALVVGGSFPSAGGLACNGLAGWNGASWTSLGGAQPGDTSVWALAIHNGKLIAAGAAPVLSGVTVNNIGAWDGSAWHALGTGTNSTVLALTDYQGELVAGGGFGIVGGQVSAYLARWSDNGTPWLALQPETSVQACLDSAFSLETTAASGYDATYQWRKDGLPLTDDGRITGSQAPMLSVMHAAPGDGGMYDCVVSTTCGGVTSSASSVVVGPRNGCVADYDCSGIVEVQDVFAFLGGWFAGDPRADVDGNGLSVQDIFDFLDRVVCGMLTKTLVRFPSRRPWISVPIGKRVARKSAARPPWYALSTTGYCGGCMAHPVMTARWSNVVMATWIAPVGAVARYLPVFWTRSGTREVSKGVEGARAG